MIKNEVYDVSPLMLKYHQLSTITQMTLPHTTNKQFEILLLIYRFRYIDRKQIQTILKHKNHRRILAWLTDLVEKNCIESIYSKKMPDNTKPTVYYLGKYGRKILQNHFTHNSEADEDEQKEENEAALYQLTKTYKDSQRTEVFRVNCLALVDCYLLVKDYITKQRYTMIFSPLTACAMNPLFAKFDSHVEIKKKNGRKNTYALLYITNRTPRRFIRYRIAEIIKYLDKAWGYETDKPSPIILFICSNLPIKNYIKKVCESKMAYYGNPEEIIIRLTTIHEMKTEGFAGNIWTIPKIKDVW